MPIICFFGPDGSGKTTLARKLAKKISDEGFVVRLSWMRGSHTMASILATCLSHFSSFRGSNNPYYGITIPSNLRRIWQLTEFASALPIILYKFVLPNLLGRWIVAERYAPDFITWVSLTTNDQCYIESIEAKFLLSLSSKTHAKIHVTATLNELLKRRKETNPAFLTKQLQLYNKITLAINANRLDTTNKSTNESIEYILSLISTQ